MIKDSGERTDFGGAVRDCAKGKGRMDLVPTELLSILFKSPIAHLTKELAETGDYHRLLDIICIFSKEYELRTGEKMDKETLILELSKHFEEGAEKYKENNWRSGNGIPVQRYLDSALRHYVKWVRGDNDERHDRAFIWNCVCMWWTINYMGDKNGNKRNTI